MLWHYSPLRPWNAASRDKASNHCSSNFYLYKSLIKLQSGWESVLLHCRSNIQKMSSSQQATTAKKKQIFLVYLIAKFWLRNKNNKKQKNKNQHHFVHGANISSLAVSFKGRRLVWVARFIQKSRKQFFTERRVKTANAHTYSLLLSSSSSNQRTQQTGDYF